MSYPNHREAERHADITWNELTEREPQLNELLWQARGASVGCRRWSDVERTFAPIRNALTEHAVIPILDRPFGSRASA